MGGTKKRMVQALLSPRKRAGNKNGSRPGGDGGKQGEDGDPSNPKQVNDKP